MKTPIVFTEKCLLYGSWHIEGPDRVKAIKKVLLANKFKFLESKPAAKSDVLKVHDAHYVLNVRKGLVDDLDTPAYYNIYAYARLAAGAAMMAAEVNGFSLMRPPGHHAGRNGLAMGVYTRGYCFFNNIAIAVRHVNKPTLILDIDGHHGNGTQEIFFGDSKITYISIHKHLEYPGTGAFSKGNCLNFPLKADCGEQTYLKTLDKALDNSRQKEFDVLAVSAGFDTYKGDLGSLGLTESSYTEIGKRIASIRKPTFFVLEGGYDVKKIGICVNNFLQGYEEAL